ncbi:helix-turn-helix transcriptional regulator [Rhizobium lemnae]|uniref:Transcriptional regulator VisR n=1 Tax=Rhizobium lemnae TaxID=1214924 RepID=A0ABV8EA10_9HYPH|nr:helix-turn-helix transcriptional regulator [Rhizobium lemnae]MCJ8506392.1 helix-turn-helix transcriptional regulator [Rhizobium lemnae]
MQRALNARNFAVFRVSGSGLPNKRKLVCEMENWGVSAAEHCGAFLQAYSERLLNHIELSLLPMVWKSRGHAETILSVKGSGMTVMLDGQQLSFEGIAFPVRLGAIGNGYVAFAGSAMDLSNDLVIDQHVRSCHVMMDLLAMDERRSIPAESLSEREVACLQLAGDGQISEEIAERLGLSVHTVNAYLGSATIKLDAVNRIQAIAKAIRLGFIH